MLRISIKSAVLNHFNSKRPLGKAIRYQSIANADPQIKTAEESAKPFVKKSELPNSEESERLSQFRNKLKEDMAAIEMNRYNLMAPKEDDPLPPWPNNVNPHTGEVGGPRGLEPTRYGDWERKGICVDF